MPVVWEDTENKAAAASTKPAMAAGAYAAVANEATVDNAWTTAQRMHAQRHQVR